MLVDLASEWLSSGEDVARLVLVVRSRASALAVRARLDDKLARAHATPLIRTHEQLARSVLSFLGGPAAVGQVLSPTGQWLAMHEALRRAAPSLPRLGGLADEPSATDDALAVVSACKRALVEPGLLAQRLRQAPDNLRELAVVAASYQHLLGRMGARDPRDGHGLALEALMADRGAMAGWADLLLVDESEDLSPAQWFLIRELAARLTPPGRLVMAGHWSESTPGFRGVSSESSSRPFEEYFPSELSPHEWVLPSALPSWAVAAGASLGLDTQAGADRGAEEGEALRPAAFRVGPRVSVWVAPDETDEALSIAREIVRARLQDGLRFSEIAILVRAPNRQLAPIRAALSAVGVPYQAPGSRSLAGNPEAAVWLNWLAVLCSPADPEPLRIALSAGPRAVPPAALRVLRRAAARRNLTQPRLFWDWVRGVTGLVDLDGRERPEAKDWERLRQAGTPWLGVTPEIWRRPRGELTWPEMQHLLGQVELASGLSDLAMSDMASARALAELARSAEATADVQRRLGRPALALSDWLQQMRLAVRHGGGDPDQGWKRDGEEVSLLTIRQSKGSSWNRVFLCGCAAGTIPGAPDAGGLLDSDEVQEMVRCLPELEDVLSSGDRQQDAEARLFLVGLTRATGETTCSWARRAQGRVVERSPFLRALFEAGATEISAPRPELVHRDDVITELALAPSGSVELAADLSYAASELRAALAPWDPVEGGPAEISSPVSLSATSVASWLACPRQYLGYLLGPASDTNVNLILGLQAHRLLELLQQERAAWADDPGSFGQVAAKLVRERLVPEVRAELSDGLEVVYVGLWLDRLVARWARRMVAPGRDRVGQPVAAEVSFELTRDAWRMRGKVDALWRRPDGEVELIDYKTSRTPLSDGAVRREVFGPPPDGPTQWQLPIYQIAARAGLFEKQLAGELPALMRNWYVGADPGPRDPDPIPASGFRMVHGDGGEGGVGTMTDAELDRIESELDGLAQAILAGRFPAQPRHQQRTCRDRHGRDSCALSFWCDGEGSVGRRYPTPAPEL